LPAFGKAWPEAITLRQTSLNDKEWQFSLQVAQFRLNKAQS
jgi:hypothetical protein